MIYLLMVLYSPVLCVFLITFCIPVLYVSVKIVKLIFCLTILLLMLSNVSTFFFFLLYLYYTRSIYREAIITTKSKINSEVTYKWWLKTQKFKTYIILGNYSYYWILIKCIYFFFFFIISILHPWTIYL
jgi:hypothetical protein